MLFCLVPPRSSTVEGPAWREIPGNFYDGLMCVLFDYAGSNHAHHFVCPTNVQSIMFIYNILTFARYLMTLTLLKYGGDSGSVWIFLSASLSLPITNICFSSRFLMGAFAESPKHQQYFCSAISFVGLLTYAYANKYKEWETKAADAAAAATAAAASESLLNGSGRGGSVVVVDGHERGVSGAADESLDTSAAEDAAVEALAAAVGASADLADTAAAAAAGATPGPAPASAGSLLNAGAAGAGNNAQPSFI